MKDNISVKQNYKNNDRSIQIMKIKIVGLKKSANHNYFIANKEEAFLENFRKFLHNIGFQKSESAKLLSPLGDTDNNYSAEKYNSRLYEDKYFYLSSENYSIDVFFGRIKVIVSIFSKTDRQREIAGSLFRYFRL